MLSAVSLKCEERNATLDTMPNAGAPSIVIPDWYLPLTAVICVSKRLTPIKSETERRLTALVGKHACGSHHARGHAVTDLVEVVR